MANTKRSFMSRDLTFFNTSATFIAADNKLSHNVSPPLSLEVITADDPERTDDKLNRAINRLIPIALERRHGIRVIRHGHGKYTVQIDVEVPCGTTMESRD
ncbi:hypothetical protein J7I84_07610 [Arthrobacter sp. ISL-85]|uniref:hypothetical protein n=1 Tax=Arthrobacter sp. ISL-85 TaxID=2819115 RepID=UPI001BE576DD|nr:hypothetical protein [Arthrobacter sp. ISL-85]MBT2566358.1 hypothetical protein [Arthrobacter sp. ISL-85]